MKKITFLSKAEVRDILAKSILKDKENIDTIKYTIDEYCKNSMDISKCEFIKERLVERGLFEFEIYQLLDNPPKTLLCLQLVVEEMEESHQESNTSISSRNMVTPDRDVGFGCWCSNSTEINRFVQRSTPKVTYSHHHPHSVVHRLNRNHTFINQFCGQDFTNFDQGSNKNENKDSEIKPCPFYCMACRDIVQSDKVVLKGFKDTDSIDDNYKVELCKQYQPKKLLQLDRQKINQNQRQKNINETNTAPDNIYQNIQHLEFDYQVIQTPKAHKYEDLNKNELENDHEHKKTSLSVFKKIRNIYKFINSKPEWILCGFACIGVVQLCVMIYLVFCS